MKSFLNYQNVATALLGLSNEIAIHLWCLYLRKLTSLAYHEQIFLRAGFWVEGAATASLEQSRRQLVLNAIVDRMYELRPTLEGWYPYFQSHLAMRLCEAYENSGDKQNIDDAIHAYEMATDGAKKGHWRPPFRSVLWAMLSKRFEEPELLDNIERVVNVGRGTPEAILNQYHQVASLSNLADILALRFDCTGSMEDLNRAIEMYTEAHEAVSEDSIHAKISNNLGRLLTTRFGHMGSLEDVDRAIDLANEALEAHPRRFSVLNNLGTGLFKRAERTGSMTDLNSAMDIFDEALKASEVDNCADRGIVLSNLQLCLDLRYERTGFMEDLNSAIEKGFEALKACSNEPSRALCLNLLGMSLFNRSNRKGSAADLDISIKLLSEALSLPFPYIERMAPLTNLGASLFSRYERTMSLEDLERSIALADEALQVMPSGQYNQPQMLSNLASRLSSRFKATGSMDDLMRAVEVLSEALELIPLDHPDRASKLSSLGGLLVLRYQRTRSREDLDHAIQAAKEATDASQIHHPDRLSLLMESKNVLSYESERDSNVDALNRIVEIDAEILELLPLDHPDRVKWLNDLSEALGTRFDHRGSADDIDRAVRTMNEVVEATPAHDVARSERLSMLATWLSRRYQCTESIDDSSRAINVAHEALKATALNHPSRPRALNTLRYVLVCQFERTKSFGVIEPFLPVFKEGWKSSTAPPSQRILAAEGTVYLLDLNSDWDESSSLMEAAVRLLPLVSPRSLKHADKELGLKIHNGLASRATAYALRAGRKPYDALKTLELGRGIIASFLMDLREDISGAEQCNPDLATEFICLRNKLDRPIEKSTSWDPSGALSFELEEKKRRETDNRLNEVIMEIRSQPETSDFLLPPSEGDLKNAAKYGPIIVINVDDFRCDAILIEEHQIAVLSLPELNLDDLKEHVRALQASRNTFSSQIELTLEWLWNAAAGPCLDALGYKSPITDGNWPRVWWIPTGPLIHLPLHAAGKHRKVSTDTVIDRVVSSYTSSVKALLHGRRRKHRKTEGSSLLNALLVVMPDTPSQSDLQFAVDETAMLESLCPSLHMNPIWPLQRTREEILKHIRSSTIFHFAGHGLSNPLEPSESCLLLKDWQTDPFTMSDLRGLRLQDSAPPFLAYLSACSTGANEAEDLDDEGINLISACQLAGFRHVIGTLWEVSDRHCVQIARTVYETLRDEGLTDAAVARGLHRATKALRDDSMNQPSPQARQRDFGEDHLTCAANNKESSDTWESGEERDGTSPVFSSVKRTRRSIMDPFWIPYTHYGV